MEWLFEKSSVVSEVRRRYVIVEGPDPRDVVNSLIAIDTPQERRIVVFFTNSGDQSLVINSYERINDRGTELELVGYIPASDPSQQQVAHIRYDVENRIGEITVSQ